MTDLPDLEITIQPDDYRCLICQQPSVFPSTYCQLCGNQNQHMNPSAMSDFNQYLAKLNAAIGATSGQMDALRKSMEEPKSPFTQLNPTRSNVIRRAVMPSPNLAIPRNLLPTKEGNWDGSNSPQISGYAPTTWRRND